MQTEVISELFPLLAAADPETLDGLLSVAVEHEYPAGRAVLMEDAWGNAVYFITSGWVKVRRTSGNSEDVATLAILGRGDFFGEMAVLDESPRSTDVIALSSVKLLSIAAGRFIQTLFKDPQLHHRMLQLMVRRLRQTNLRSQLRDQPPAVKLIHTLVSLAEAYGNPTSEGVEIFNIAPRDLADVSDVGGDDASKIISRLIEKGWIKVQSDRSILLLPNIRQMQQLLSKSST
jgi:CRP/FNR family transcriptional regulator, cyclic AMP receptor protein